jgi:hypothetical protein
MEFLIRLRFLQRQLRQAVVDWCLLKILQELVPQRKEEGADQRDLKIKRKLLEDKNGSCT